MSASDQIKNLIRKGREDGYIIKSDLNKCLEPFSLTDQNYIKNTIEGFKIQIVDKKSHYDELKYLSGKDAIDFCKISLMVNIALFKKISTSNNHQIFSE